MGTYKTFTAQKKKPLTKNLTKDDLDGQFKTQLVSPVAIKGVIHPEMLIQCLCWRTRQRAAVEKSVSA